MSWDKLQCATLVIIYAYLNFGNAMLKEVIGQQCMGAYVSLKVSFPLCQYLWKNFWVQFKRESKIKQNKKLTMQKMCSQG